MGYILWRGIYTPFDVDVFLLKDFQVYRPLNEEVHFIAYNNIFLFKIDFDRKIVLLEFKQLIWFLTISLSWLVYSKLFSKQQSSLKHKSCSGSIHDPDNLQNLVLRQQISKEQDDT